MTTTAHQATMVPRKRRAETKREKTLLELSLESMRKDVQHTFRREARPLDIGFFEQLVDEAVRRERAEAVVVGAEPSSPKTVT